MKKLMLAVCLMFGGATLVSAQDQASSRQSQSTQMDQDQQRISVSQLPEEVSSKLESQDYSGWTVDGAYTKQDSDHGQLYIVEMRQGNETKKVKFDAQGNEIDKKDKRGHKKSGQSSSNYNDNESSSGTLSQPGQSGDESGTGTQTDRP